MTLNLMHLNLLKLKLNRFRDNYLNLAVFRRVSQLIDLIRNFVAAPIAVVAAVEHLPAVIGPELALAFAVALALFLALNLTVDLYCTPTMDIF